MLIRRVAAIFDTVIAVVTGYWGLQMMFSPSGGGRFFWWPLTTFGASILLLVGSVLVMFLHIRRGWLVSLAATIFFVVWVALVRDFSWTYCIFTVTVVLITWAILALSSALKRPGVAPFAASLMLSVSWLPGSVNAFHAYLFPDPPARNPPVLLPLLVLWALIIASLITGAMLWRSSGARRPVQLAAPSATTTK
jgi:hypothetical protein